MHKIVRRLLLRQKGQSIALFSLFLIFAFIGFLALTIDVGFLYGQRRFDQNGADAAALAAAQYMASNVAPANSDATSVYFSVTSAEVVGKVLLYAGLTNAHNNQNSTLGGRTSLNVSVEYSKDNGTTWCYSTAAGATADPTISACTPYVLNGVNYPPQPGNSPYKVRVILRSTTESFFAQAFLGGGSGNIGQGSASCLPAPSATGMLTCARATAMISGSPATTSGSNIIPTGVANCRVSTTPGQLYELWGSSGNLHCDDGTTFSYGNWASIVDVSSETTWCDDNSSTNGQPGSSSNPDYLYHGILPAASHVATGQCQTLSTYPWNRTGYSADPTYPNASYPHSGIISNDVQWWIAKGFQGSIAVGNQLPTYIHANPSQNGNQGQNIAAGFYCGSATVTTTSCGTTTNIAGTYFFAQNQTGYNATCPDDFGTVSGKPLGCRDANVILWGNPESIRPNDAASASSFVSTNSSPDRVQVMRILNFRFYCEHEGDVASGICDQPPSALGNPITNSNSTVWGRFVGPFKPPPAPCPTCGPSIYGDTASMTE